MKKEVVGFNDVEVEPSLDFSGTIDETRNRLTGSDCSLGDFMSRPVKLGTYEWTPTVPFYVKLDPWNLFLTNKRISNRISNYKMAKMTLNIKILVNGNSFFYGKLIAVYQPFEPLDNMTVNTQFTPTDLVQMSQMPRIFLDPTTSTGGELKLPFFYFMDYLDLTYDSWTDMGRLTIRPLNDLKHIQGVAAINEVVSISVFAWATDVDLQGPTHMNAFGITPQSGKDEYEGNTGPISKPASAIAAAATALSILPPLKPFCTATAMAASTTAKVASLLGYSAPVMVEEPQLVLPRACSNMAVTNTPDAAAKLTVDVKQELTIDPRTLGLDNIDELDIAHIASRDSFLKTFDWAKGTVPDTMLWNVVVDPCVHQRASVSGDDTLCIPACCGAAIPFEYWNGSMEYRFQIVASAFHRGRLAIVYDADSTPTTLESNVVYTEVIDISSCREFSLKIANHSPLTLMSHISPGTVLESSFMSTSAITPAAGNGTLSVWVINELTSSNTDLAVNDDISINVFIKAGDDFEVFVPSDDMYRYVIKPQSGSDAVDPVMEDNEPYPDTDKTLGEAADLVSSRNLVYTGEKVVSFRQMLKRYYRHSAFGSTDNMASHDRLRVTMMAFPFYRGNVPGAIHLTSLSAPYTFAGKTMINWLAPAFQAMRGGIRYKIMTNSNNGGYPAGLDTFYVARTSDEVYSISGDTVLNTNPSALARHAVVNSEGHRTILGATGFNIHVNPVVEFEVPYYSKYRFAPGKVTNWTTLSNPFMNQGFTMWTGNESGGNNHFQVWVAAAEDFSLYFFTGWPRLYYEATNPASLP